MSRRSAAASSTGRIGFEPLASTDSSSMNEW